MFAEGLTAGKSIQQANQLRAIAPPFGGRRSSDALFYFRPGRHTRRPSQWSAQSYPSNKCPLQNVARRAGVFLAHGNAEGIVEMAHHLARRHPSPSCAGIWTQPLDAVSARSANVGIGERAHYLLF